MSCDPILDQRPCRVDLASSVGSTITWTVDWGTDVSACTFTAGLLGPDGVPAVRDDLTPLPTLDLAQVASGVVSLSVLASQTEEEPLAPGTWTWWLACDDIDQVGGRWTLSPRWQFNDDCAATTGVGVVTPLGPATVSLA